MTNNEIELVSSDVLNKYVNRGGSYKQFLNIMQSEGIKFKEAPITNEKFTGALTFGLNDQPYIMINKSINNPGRRNFTIAHELGHFFLNHKLHQNYFFCQDNQISEESDVSDGIEQEANYFASCFLMPGEKVTKAFLGILKNSKKVKNKRFLIVTNETYGIWCNIRDTLTERYGVSEAALRYRLIKLNLLEIGF